MRTPRERQRQIVGEWSESGVSAARFAETIGVRYQTLAKWIRKHGGGVRAAVVRDVPPRWLEMAVARRSSCQAGGLRVELPGGAAMLLGEPSQLPMAVQLLRALS